jgi:hypothetical protein
MNYDDVGMTAAEQDDAEGVFSPRAGPIRIAGRSWYSYDGPAAATAGVRHRFCLETESTALAGNGGHSSDHRSISPERAAPYPPRSAWASLGDLGEPEWRRVLSTTFLAVLRQGSRGRAPRLFSTIRRSPNAGINASVTAQVA